MPTIINEKQQNAMLVPLGANLAFIISAAQFNNPFVTTYC